MDKRNRSRAEPVSTSAICKECGARLPRGGRKCTKCGAYLNPWKRRLQFLSAVAGGVALIGAAIAYTSGALPALRRRILWQTELRVVEFESTRVLTVLNTGDGPVLISDVTLWIDQIGSISISIGKTVRKDETLREEVLLPEHRAKTSVLLAHVSPEEWLQAIRIARQFDDMKCVFPIAFVDSDPHYRFYATAGRLDPHHFPSLLAHFTLHFRDLHSGIGRLSLPAHAFLFRRSDCQSGMIAAPGMH